MNQKYKMQVKISRITMLSISPFQWIKEKDRSRKFKYTKSFKLKNIQHTKQNSCKILLPQYATTFTCSWLELREEHSLDLDTAFHDVEQGFHSILHVKFTNFISFSVAKEKKKSIIHEFKLYKTVRLTFRSKFFATSTKILANYDEKW